MPRIWTTGVAAALFLMAAPAGASEAANKVIQQARADCRSFDNGTLETGPEALILADLTGDGSPEEIIDSRHFACSTAASLFCGTGGCEITVIAEQKATNFLAKDWEIVSWDGQPVLLLAVHGSACGGTNLRKCVKAVVWSEGAFRGLEP